MVCLGCLFTSSLHASLEATSNREQTRIKAVTLDFVSEKDAYIKIHKACHKIWSKNYKDMINQRATLSVEVVTLTKNPNKISALCVSKRYQNNQVKKVATR